MLIIPIHSIIQTTTNSSSESFVCVPNTLNFHVGDILNELGEKHGIPGCSIERSWTVRSWTEFAECVIENGFLNWLHPSPLERKYFFDKTQDPHVTSNWVGILKHLGFDPTLIPEALESTRLYEIQDPPPVNDGGIGEFFDFLDAERKKLARSIRKVCRWLERDQIPFPNPVYILDDGMRFDITEELHEEMKEKLNAYLWHRH